MLVKDKKTNFIINDDDADYRRIKQAYAQAGRMKDVEDRLNILEKQFHNLHQLYMANLISFKDNDGSSSS